MELEVPDRHAALLRSMAKLPDLAALPQQLQDAYWELARCGNRISDGITLADLKWLCFHVGFGKAQSEPPREPSIIELWRAKRVKANAQVLVQWRGEEQSATLLRVTGTEVAVEFADGTKQKVQADKVRVAELVEA